MNESFDEPSLPALPQRVRRPLMALWVSLAVHGALIGLIQVAPSGAPAGGSIVLQARLDPAVPRAPEPDPPLQPSPTLKPTEILDAAPPAPPVAPTPELPAATAVPPPAAPPVEPSRPALAIDSGVDLTYYTARELDQPPTARGAINLAYPPEAERARVSGTVRLRVKVEADGRVSDVDVVESTPTGVFDASAIEAFRAARFNPGQKDGRPVRALMLIEVSYDWEGRL
ncbi:MAG: energy transducer TonB [Burkholderiales bacterium]